MIHLVKVSIRKRYYPVRINERDVVEALKEKATDYVAKPFRQMELLKRVKQHVK